MFMIYAKLVFTAIFWGGTFISARMLVGIFPIGEVGDG